MERNVMENKLPQQYYIRLKILHIEDDKWVRITVERLLNHVSYADVEVVSVGTLEKGLVQVQDDPTWDCILLDLALPDCSGITTFHHIHAVTDTPIVVLTAETSLSKRVEVVAAGAQDCLFKPEQVTPDAMIRSIRFAVERHRTVQELRVALREVEAANAAMRRLLEERE
jgi:DNA-binding response OmpR family regulator